MTDSVAVMESPVCFQLKTSFSPCTILQITHYDLAELGKQLWSSVQKAPNFFMGSPVIIDVESLREEIDFVKLKKILIDTNLVPVGIRGGTPTQFQAAVDAGIPKITVGIGKKSAAPLKANEDTTESDPNESHASEAVPEPVVSPLGHYQAAKIITTPIRSGMSVYAKDSDLIITSSVSPGAELMADGNIHVYGPLRGRALAGVQGNINARIFCRTLEAELVAIAGYYLVKEDIQNLSVQDATVQVWLEDEKVKIAAL
jgi:septum site-determining protein MinC